MVRIDPRASEWRYLDGEIVGLDLQRNEFFSIKGSGVALWRQLVDGADADELVRLLTMRYALSPEQATKDVAAFMTSLADRGLLMP